MAKCGLFDLIHLFYLFYLNHNCDEESMEATPRQEFIARMRQQGNF